jgi:hypothetical protein
MSIQMLLVSGRSTIASAYGGELASESKTVLAFLVSLLYPAHEKWRPKLSKRVVFARVERRVSGAPRLNGSEGRFIGAVSRG